ncbi:hypothetical protein HK405_011566, partial [Cladochytrium tenue]
PLPGSPVKPVEDHEGEGSSSGDEPELSTPVTRNPLTQTATSTEPRAKPLDSDGDDTEPSDRVSGPQAVRSPPSLLLSPPFFFPRKYFLSEESDPLEPRTRLGRRKETWGLRQRVRSVVDRRCERVGEGGLYVRWR